MKLAQSPVYKTPYRKYKYVQMGIIFYLYFKPIGIYHSLFTKWRYIRKYETLFEAATGIDNELMFDRLESQNISWNTLEEAELKYKTIYNVN